MPNEALVAPTHKVEVFRRALLALRGSNLRFLVGGAYALAAYTGVTRPPKDLDVFCHPDDAPRLLEALADAGFDTVLPYPHWLGKALEGHVYIDVIYGSSNGIAVVDEEWFTHAPHGELMGVPVPFCPPEETIWSKAWVMDRERFDGADIAHLVRATAEDLDWARLVRRFGEEHAPVLLCHLLLFAFVYPGERDRIPSWVQRSLLESVARQQVPASPNVCRGPLFSGEQYRIDVERWGYSDARLRPEGPLGPDDIARPIFQLPAADGRARAAASPRRRG